MRTTDSARIEQAAADWLARRDGDLWTEADEARLAAWLEASTAHRVAFLRLEHAWSETGRLQALAAGRRTTGPPDRGRWGWPQPSDDGGTGSRPDRPPAMRRSRRGGRLFAAAATLVLGMAALWVWRVEYRVERATYATAMGALDSVRLSDGSRATLSSDTRIEIALSRHERRIDLQDGEAFFEAAKDPERPFVIAAGDRRVVAVGTRFSVRRSETDLRVVVTEGVVRLEVPSARAGAADIVRLLPAGAVAVVDHDGVSAYQGSLASAERALEWRGGFLRFEDTSLAEAAEEFNRFHARKLVMGDAEVAALRIGGNFRWSNLDGFVRLLESGFAVRVERRGELIVLHSR
ncbi:MAG: FecR family protein [Pseudomonadota bacterium]